MKHLSTQLPPVSWQTRTMGGYTPRQRDPNEALPYTISVHKLPPYTPPVNAAARPGADDHKAVRSRGVPT